MVWASIKSERRGRQLGLGVPVVQSVEEEDEEKEDGFVEVKDEGPHGGAI